MKLELVRIGNSRGIRIPKPLIEQCGFGNTVELRVERDRLIIEPDRSPREGWAEAFKTAGCDEDPLLLLESPVSNDFDEREWRW